jgi:hypothetical protein
VDTTPTRRRIAALITALALGGSLAACDDRTNVETSNPSSQDPQSKGVDVGTNPAQAPGRQTGDQGEGPGGGDGQEGENTP